MTSVFARRSEPPTRINCTAVQLYRVENGGHAEPSISEQYSSVFEQFVGKQNHDLEMVREIWGFFATMTFFQ